jgi:hypothetical protein
MLTYKIELSFSVYSLSLGLYSDKTIKLFLKLKLI